MRATKFILISILTWCSASPVLAQTFEPPTDSHVYAIGSGDETFLLWKAVGVTGNSFSYLKFSGSDEIWLVSQHLGSRGAVLYKNDTGRVVFRHNVVSGSTLYPDAASKGVPVWRSGHRKAHRLDSIDPNKTDEDMKSIEDWSRAYAYVGTRKTSSIKPELDAELHIDHRIEFADWPTNNTDYKVEIGNHLSSFLAKHPQNEIDRIVVRIAKEPTLERDRTGLTIWVNPNLGYAGRPSSEKILKQISTARG